MSKFDPYFPEDVEIVACLLVYHVHCSCEFNLIVEGTQYAPAVEQFLASFLCDGCVTSFNRTLKCVFERSTCYNGRRTIIVRSDFCQNSLKCSFVLPSARHLHSPIADPVARIQRQRAGAYARQRRFGERRASKTNACVVVVRAR